MYTHLQRDQARPPVTLATLARMKADGLLAAIKRMSKGRLYYNPLRSRAI